MRTILILAAIAFACASPPLNAAAPPAPTPSPASLISDLGAPSFATREAAQRQLENLPPSSLDTLRQAKAQADDLETEMRLDNAIALIEDRAALNPPNLSLKVKDAPLADVFHAIQSQMPDAPFPNQGDLSKSPFRYTLNLQNTSLYLPKGHERRSN